MRDQREEFNSMRIKCATTTRDVTISSRAFDAGRKFRETLKWVRSARNMTNASWMAVTIPTTRAFDAGRKFTNG